MEKLLERASGKGARVQINYSPTASILQVEVFRKVDSENPKNKFKFVFPKKLSVGNGFTRALRKTGSSTLVGARQSTIASRFGIYTLHSSDFDALNDLLEKNRFFCSSRKYSKAKIRIHSFSN